MRFLNEQAQLFVVAAVCFLVGIACLYFALGLWAWCIDRACKIVGIHGAITAWILQKENRKAWWRRVALWYYNTFQAR